MIIRVKSSRQPFRRAGFEFGRQWQVIEAISAAALLILILDPVLQVQRQGDGDDDWLPVTEDDAVAFSEAEKAASDPKEPAKEPEKEPAKEPEKEPAKSDDKPKDGVKK